MTKLLFPWHKLQLWYRFCWLDWEFMISKPIAHPTWYLTHSPRRIQRRVDKYNRERIRNLTARIEMCTAILEQRKLQENQNNSGNSPV